MQNWENIIKPPLSGRPQKPRTSGISMVLDKGLSVGETRNLLETGASFIDFIKLSFGTIALFQPEILVAKINAAAEFHIPVYPGGTFLEIAFWENRLDPVLDQLKDIGIKWVEISDGTLSMTAVERRNLITKALTNGFNVITEVGKKDPDEQPDECHLISTAYQDLDCGAQWVIVEARESGKNIGVYDHQGGIINEKLNTLRNQLPLANIIWEAPLKNQQAALINQFGPAVNLGNIPTTEVIALEALRQGFRSDTWRNVL